jgi:uncharacterized protein YbbC (DUF1343 family)
MQTQPAVIVCDRPNPLGGIVIDGPLLDLAFASGYGAERIPHVHGMTVGELSLLFNSRLTPAISNLRIIKTTGWARKDLWPPSLAWIPPSPNIPTPQSALAYPVTVFLEATTVSEGRGTTTPFEMFGAPFIDSRLFTMRLNNDANCSTSACFRSAFYQPTFSKYNASVVNGTQFISRGLRLSPFTLATQILVAFRDLSTPASAFLWDGSWFYHPGTVLIDWYAGTDEYRLLINSGANAEAIVAKFAPDKVQFAADRQPYLLY